ncbi:MAG: oligosaccharide flippase family protein [Hyphomicrobiales bacterium]|nr:oligosaccharide flippase family protein [Hyphomicrobiales bacterium]
MPAISLKAIAYALSPSFAHPVMKKIESSDIGLRLARGVFWSMAGSVISRGLMLCATILVARMLGKAVYGELGMIQLTVGMFGVLAGFGLGLTATKHVAEFRKNDPDRAGRIIGISGLFATLTGGLMALGLVIFATWLAENTINAPHLTDVLRIGAIMLFLSALNGAQTGALAGFEAFKTIAYVNLCIGLLSFPILVGGAYIGGLTGAVWAMTINLGINWLLNHLALRKEAKRHKVPFTFRDCRRELPVLWRFSLPAALGGIVVGPVNWICSAMLVNQPNGYGEMGMFNAANQWFIMMLFLPGIFGNVILPVLSDQLGQNDTRGSSKTLLLSIKLNVIIVTPLVLIACIASPFIMSLYGEEFAAGWPTLVVVFLTAGLLATQTPAGQIIAASGKMWTGLMMNIGWALIFIVSTLLLIDNGALGLAYARLIGYLFHTVWVFAFIILFLRRRRKKNEKY